ncbi:YqjF family protein [Halobacillus sp. K22]|uniref:YqjF family protein n=1 Tax=Halobacillus sp. K22 TaxID=3457431 RepID=UPI003FCEB94A
MYEKIIMHTGHRNSPLPNGKWMLSQKWQNLLFMHVPVAKEALQELLPEGLELDCYQGEAWVSILPFEVTDMHFRNTPAIPYLHSYLELNVRTYVKRKGIPGLYFFSLDANKLLAVVGASFTTLPYRYAQMDMCEYGDTIHFQSKRLGKNKASLQAAFRPHSSLWIPDEDSLDAWLLERYYAWRSIGNTMVELGIHHLPWQVQKVEADLQSYQITPFHFEHIKKGRLIFHFSPAKRVLFWPLRIIK